MVGIFSRFSASKAIGLFAHPSPCKPESLPFKEKFQILSVMGGIAYFKLVWKEQLERISVRKYLPRGPRRRLARREIVEKDFAGTANEWVPPTNGEIDVQETKEEVGTEKEATTSPVDRGVEPAEEFTSIEHPMEPTENDQPVRCPQPEPCIVHDGRIWKERLQLSMKRRGELQFIRENEAQGLHQRRHSVSNERLILPSASAPVGAITKYLE